MSAASQVWVSAFLPQWSRPMFQPKRYKVPKGGRGSSKSWTIAQILLILSGKQKLRILCTREFQKTIKDSVHKLLKDTIERLGYGGFFRVTDGSVIGKNGAEFIFAGLHANIAQIKSMEGIDICWVEEAETVSEYSWKNLIPTIRRDSPELAKAYGVEGVVGAEIWVSYNPREETDPTSVRFDKNPPDDALVINVNWQDNPFFPMTLRKEMEYDYRVDPDAAAWVWGGQYRKRSAAQIFAGKYTVEAFETPHSDPKLANDTSWDGPWFGLDWGFSTDPLSAHKYWGKGNTLYVEHEVYALGVELNDISRLLIAGLPEIEKRYVVRADCSRPETISHVRGFGLNVTAAEKWPGSVEDGIAWLRSLEQIIIHPRCEHAIQEARLYSWKVDKLTGDIQPVPIDKHNHFWDDCRYAMQPAIKTAEREIRMVHEEQISIAPELDEIEQPEFMAW